MERIAGPALAELRTAWAKQLGCSSMTRVENVTADAVAAQLRALETMSIAKLRLAWRRLYRAEPPKRATRDLLTLAVAWKIQEQAYGGLTAATRRHLAHLATTMARDGDVKRARVARLKSGAKLVREWRGRTHTILVTEDGFAWQGRSWQSLSMIARAITGVRWSGPRFFGLKGVPAREAEPATAEPAHA